MQKTIQAIVHPFYQRYEEESHAQFYKKIVDSVVNDPNSFLYFIATRPKSKVNQLPAAQSELQLQDYIRQLSSDVKDRVAIFAEDSGEEQWKIDDGYHPMSVRDIKDHPEEAPLSWFANHHAHAFYDPHLKSAYVDITGMSERHRSRIKRFDDPIMQQDGREFVRYPLHPQIAKLVRFLKPSDGNLSINGEHMLTIPDETTKATRIIGSGIFVDGCAFNESVSLSLMLGIPVQNISLNTEQPYLVKDLGEKRDTIWFKNPVEALYPTITKLESPNNLS